jgi:hypothetical protein
MLRQSVKDLGARFARPALHMQEVQRGMRVNQCYPHSPSVTAIAARDFVRGELSCQSPFIQKPAKTSRSDHMQRLPYRGHLSKCTALNTDRSSPLASSVLPASNSIRYLILIYQVSCERPMNEW